MLRDLTPWGFVAGVCCLWPALVGAIAFLIGRGYRVRVEKP